MAIIDDVRSLAEAVTAIPSKTVLKVIKVLLTTTTAHWKEEVIRHHTAMGKYPKGSRMYLSAQNAYVAAFQNWSRTSFTLTRVSDAEVIDNFSEKHLKASAEIPACFFVK